MSREEVRNRSISDPGAKNGQFSASVDSRTRERAHAHGVHLVIAGVCCSAKNSRRILRNRRTGRPLSAKSAAALRFCQDFALQVPPELRGLNLGSETQPLRAVITVWYPSRRFDLDCALIYDCLQASGVVANDRFFLEKHEFKQFDADEPRAEIFLEEI